MPLSWQLRDHIFVLTASRDYGLEDFDRVVQEVRSDSRHQPELSLLFDARRSESAMTVPMMHHWVSRVLDLRRIGFSKRCALVVSDREPYRLGMARLAAGHLGARGMDLKVSRDFEAALAALGRTSSVPQPASPGTPPRPKEPGEPLSALDHRASDSEGRGPGAPAERDSPV